MRQTIDVNRGDEDYFINERNATVHSSGGVDVNKGELGNKEFQSHKGQADAIEPGQIVGSSSEIKCPSKINAVRLRAF